MSQSDINDGNRTADYRQLRLKADTHSAISILDAAERDGLSVGEAAIRLINEGAFATTEEGWRATYEGNADLQAEFATVQDYCGWRGFERRGGNA